MLWPLVRPRLERLPGPSSPPHPRPRPVGSPGGWRTPSFRDPTSLPRHPEGVFPAASWPRLLHPQPTRRAGVKVLSVFIPPTSLGAGVAAPLCRQVNVTREDSVPRAGRPRQAGLGKARTPSPGSPHCLVFLLSGLGVQSPECLLLWLSIIYFRQD